MRPIRRPLAEAGITTLDPWGNPYQYLLIQGNLPRGLAGVDDRLPPVAAPPGPTGQNATAPGAGGASTSGEIGSAGGSTDLGGAGGAGAHEGAVGNEGSGGSAGSIMASVRKDRFLAPINTDFDLYSMGPDGESRPQLNAKPSRDDIVRAANGGFFGPAEEF
jgi:general secretion pathway protein G